MPLSWQYFQTLVSLGENHTELGKAVSLNKIMNLSYK